MIPKDIRAGERLAFALSSDPKLKRGTLTQNLIDLSYWVTRAVLAIQGPIRAGRAHGMQDARPEEWLSNRDEDARFQYPV